MPRFIISARWSVIKIPIISPERLKISTAYPLRNIRKDLRRMNKYSQEIKRGRKSVRRVFFLQSFVKNCMLILIPLLIIGPYSIFKSMADNWIMPTCFSHPAPASRCSWMPLFMRRAFRWILCAILKTYPCIC